jgi:hypothetical protein
LEELDVFGVGQIELGRSVERYPPDIFDDGEVSPYLTSVADVGDQIELRGPIGGWFVWDGDHTAPVLLVGRGSGVVPLMAMLRHHAASRSTTAMRLVCSARTLSEVIYRARCGDGGIGVLGERGAGGSRAGRIEPPFWLGVPVRGLLRCGASCRCSWRSRAPPAPHAASWPGCSLGGVRRRRVDAAGRADDRLAIAMDGVVRHLPALLPHVGRLAGAMVVASGARLHHGVLGDQPA